MSKSYNSHRSQQKEIERLSEELILRETTKSLEKQRVSVSLSID